MFLYEFELRILPILRSLVNPAPEDPTYCPSEFDVSIV
jgi:hypothetical protein